MFPNFLPPGTQGPGLYGEAANVCISSYFLMNIDVTFMQPVMFLELV